ncbi:MAG: orotidine-5'-phosphate decarboxylase [Chthoniobacterales bacterium]|nr:orotidine-5'-phosphate decarboxylase [Chthoniobacterales bacterium]
MIHGSKHSRKAEIIVALDEPSLGDAQRLMDRLAGHADFYKVGLQLFTAAGSAALDAVKARGARVFLDLKLHDIPNTVASAVRSAVDLGVDMCTIHLSGGPEMAAAAVAAAGGSTAILGVTVLTSSNQATLEACGVHGSVGEQVMRLASMGRAAGVRGFVASALELPMLRAELGHDPLLVIPGVRPAGADVGDQKRTATPTEVVAEGADYLVVGRPISRAPDPAAAYDAILGEIKELEI